MTDRVTFGEAEFSFRTDDGTQYMVRTETAPDAFARVVVQELRENDQPNELEPSE